ncbi:hypothetical protein SEA_BOILGATE_75 [Mycobacterium phage Boilgate]|nr:hypothetical protein SEA_BOILGATE_75 [Mycobacterium phage Boilgate]
MTATFTTRDEAIQRVIVDPIEASGEVADARATYDVEAIADAVLGDHSVGYVCLVDADEFWRIVEQHERQYTARLTNANSLSLHECEMRSFDTLTVFLGDEEVAAITVESSDEPAPYVAALAAEGWRVVDTSGSDWIVEPAE